MKPKLKHKSKKIPENKTILRLQVMLPSSTASHDEHQEESFLQKTSLVTEQLDGDDCRVFLELCLEGCGLRSEGETGDGGGTDQGRVEITRWGAIDWLVDWLIGWSVINSYGKNFWKWIGKDWNSWIRVYSTQWMVVTFVRRTFPWLWWWSFMEMIYRDLIL